MIVEDDDETRMFLGEILEMEGFKVIPCSNGVEALNYLTHSGRPRVVIMDLRMPLMDGAQLRSAMLREPDLARIPVIIVTAYEPSSAAKLSVSRVFRKPVDVEALVDTVRAYC